ncbi:membrane protein [Sulfurifustis variabilis]|uniref:Membrane protein n=1 Tax=Sulfurifustis variabilis TaxID=1675686 RepID=A0A1C7AF42_9GAMM|nr:YeeE/YedE family protein [Sulfurifustis variabilis]BAU49855.1 membrane protein [Sulfurifustis variabilis]
MAFNIHTQVLLSIFAIAVVMGAVASRTNFCTMGAVSDLVNIGDSTRMRSWLFAIAVALLGVLALEAGGILQIGNSTFPPYRTASFAWIRYLLGGLLFGIGMTLGSGCGNKCFVRIGGGNLKSVVLLVFFAAPAAYLMLWTDLFNTAFMSWMQPTIVELQSYGIRSQELAAIVGGVSGISDAPWLHYGLGLAVGIGLLAFIFKSADFRSSFDGILGGAVIGLAVVAGWWITGGSWGTAWKEFVEFEMVDNPPSRVLVQSYTFISPMGDSVRYLMEPTNFALLNFGIMAVAGVIVGSALYSLVTRKFRFEWFASFKDFLSHAVGGVLMGVGGVLSMGCTVGQAITGVSTLALGSFLTLGSIIFGAALTMKVQYYMLDEQGFWRSVRLGLADLRVLPTPGKPA